MTSHLALTATVLACLLPGAGEACSCQAPDTDVATQLQDALVRSADVVFARVVATDGLDFGGTTTFEVTEFFKGTYQPGRRIELRSGGGGDCTLHFLKGETWLIYSSGSAVNVHVCSRSRKVAKDDAELVWLRTHKLPPIPVALQRATVSCHPCVLEDFAAALSGVVETADEAQAIRDRKPFRSTAAYARGDELSIRGSSSTQRAFELAQIQADYPAEACRAHIVRRWCSSISANDAGVWPRSQCVGAQPDEILCDENTSRKEAWDPLEAFGQSRCSWHDPVRPECKLPTERSPFDGGVPSGPIMRCTPVRDLPADWFTCRVLTE